MKRTEEDRKAWHERMNKLIKAVRALPPEKRAELAGQMGIYTPEGHPLSIFNACFLSLQAGRGDLTVCGGFRQWERKGARVRAGEHAAGYIYVPLGKRGEDGVIERPEDGGRMRFRLVPVFDVSQTEEIQDSKAEERAAWFASHPEIAAANRDSVAAASA